MSIHSVNAQLTHTNSAHFRIYYYTAGADAIDLTDNNNNGIPDYVELTHYTLEYAYSYYMDTLGFLKPPLDTAGLYNVILFDFANHGLKPGVLAETRAIDSFGDNPNSAVTELYSSRSYILLRNTYAGASTVFTENEMLSINATHEFFHVVQNGYNHNLSGFFKESTAVTITDRVSKTDFGLIHLHNFYDHPDLALNYDRKDDSLTQHQYAAWIFWKFIEEHVGTTVIKLFLERSISNINKTDELTSLQLVLVGIGTSLNKVFTDFCIANSVFSSNATAYPNYFYKDAFKYVSLGFIGSSFESAFFYTGSPLIYKSVDNNKRLMRLSTDNFYIDVSTKKFSVKCRPTIPGADIDVFLLRKRVSDHVFEIENLASRTISGIKEFWTNIDNPLDYEYYQVFVKRFDRFVNDTGSLQYELEIGSPDPWTVFDISPYSVTGYNIASDIDLDPANGNLWVTTGAILKYDGRWHTIRDPSPFGGSWAGWAKMNNKDWFGYQGGFTKYDGASTDYTFNTDTNITSGTTELVGTGSVLWKAGDRVVRYDGSSFKKFGFADGLGSEAISDIAISPVDGAVWVGSDAGVGKYFGGSWSWFTTSSGLPNNIIWSIDVSKSGTVWVGMPNGKIAKSNGGAFLEVINPDVVGGCTIPCIVDDIKLTPLEKVWVGMRSNGVSYFDGTTWKNYNAVNTGIPEMNGVHKIAVDGDSCVWFAMNSKISRYCYKTASSGISTVKKELNDDWTLFPNPAINEVSLRSSHKINSAAIYNMTGALVVKFENNFDHIALNTLTPGIYFVHINSGNNFYSVKKLIVVKN